MTSTSGGVFGALRSVRWPIAAPSLVDRTLGYFPAGTLASVADGATGETSTLAAAGRTLPTTWPRHSGPLGLCFRRLAKRKNRNLAVVDITRQWWSLPRTC